MPHFERWAAAGLVVACGVASTMLWAGPGSPLDIASSYCGVVVRLLTKVRDGTVSVSTDGEDAAICLLTILVFTSLVIGALAIARVAGLRKFWPGRALWWWTAGHGLALIAGWGIRIGYRHSDGSPIDLPLGVWLSFAGAAGELAIALYVLARTRRR